MKVTHVLSYDFKKKDYLIERALEDETFEEVDGLCDYEDAIEYVKAMSNETEIFLVDNEQDMWLHIKDGEVVEYQFEYETDAKAVKLWTDEDIEEEDEYYRCSACRDGGCIHCEPHRFI